MCVDDENIFDGRLHVLRKTLNL